MNISEMLPWGLVIFLFTTTFDAGSNTGQNQTLDSFTERRLTALEQFASSGDRYSAEDASRDFALYNQNLENKFGTLNTKIETLDSASLRRFELIDQQLESIIKILNTPESGVLNKNL